MTAFRACPSMVTFKYLTILRKFCIVLDRAIRWSSCASILTPFALTSPLIASVKENQFQYINFKDLFISSGAARFERCKDERSETCHSKIKHKVFSCNKSKIRILPMSCRLYGLKIDSPISINPNPARSPKPRPACRFSMWWWENPKRFLKL